MARGTLGLLVVVAALIVAASASSSPPRRLRAVPTNVTQIVTGYGYPCEDHEALTPDGYWLSLQRIPHGLHNAKGPRKGVVFFQHGTFDNANGICLNPPSEGLPYILADAGYEVWLGNNRGNGYSMTNIQYTTQQAEFWAFTWDEMAKYDVPTNIKYVLAQSGFSTLTYIGHSEGTTQAFAGFSINHEIASRVNLFIGMAPVAYIGNQHVLLLTVLSDFDASEILLLLGQHEATIQSAVQKFIPEACTIDPAICDNILEAFMGPSVNTNVSRIPYYLTYEPNPTSTLNVAHWAQGVSSGEFQAFDYGYEGNLKHYNQSSAPFYHLSSLPTTLPIALFTGGNDWLADPADAARLIYELPVPPVFVNTQPSYSHTDFIWADDAHELIYPHILGLLAQYNMA